MRRITLKVYGRVQGVFFRDSCRHEAQALGLTGFVRNCRDGTVEIVAEGKEEKLNELIEWAKVGPPLAKVVRLEKVEEQGISESFFANFEIR